MLLGTDHHARAHEAHVCDNLVGGEAVLVDQVCADQAASSSQSSFAVDCDTALLYCDHLVCEVDKLAYEGQRWACSVVEDHVQVLDAELGEV